MKSIILTTIAAAVLAVILVLGGTAAFTNIQKVNAQMSTSNMTGGMMGMKAGGGGAGPNVTSIKLSTVIGNALSSQIKVGLNQAAVIAEKAVGNNSHAVAAHFGVENGYLVYTVWVIDGTYNFHRVVVDAGDGKVLANQPISKEESMMMHGMMMHGGGMMMQHGRAGMMMRGGGGYGAGGSPDMMMGGPGMGKP
jgi:uncharacterized membrane protein YkoI